MCGIFAVYNSPNAGELTRQGLLSLQHRASEFAGIALTDGNKIYSCVRPGRVIDALKTDSIPKLSGHHHALGHVRYSTSEDTENGQPLLGGNIAVVHNGNFTNTKEIRAALEREGVKFQTGIDTEIVLQRFVRQENETDPVARLIKALEGLHGTYSLVILLPDRLIAVRDWSGNRPLSLGRQDGNYFISSETCALQNIGAEFIRDVEPGEIVVISSDGIQQSFLPTTWKLEFAKCVFEQIYFAWPTSLIFGKSVADYRVRLGQQLEKYCPTPNADIVVPVPNSADFIGIGYAMNSESAQFMPGIIRNRHTERTFLEKGPAARQEAVMQKFEVIRSFIEGRIVVVVDDSIVRFTTAPWITKLLSDAGAREIHMRIAAPKIIEPCYYGIDTPTKEELIASSLSTEAMRYRLGINSLQFLPIEALKELERSPNDYCYACMTGKYPLPIK